MLSNQFAFAALAAGCLTAAGVGGYVASRQDAIEVAPQAAALNEDAVAAPVVASAVQTPQDTQPAPVAVQARQTTVAAAKRVELPEARVAASEASAPAVQEARTSAGADLDAAQSAPPNAEPSSSVSTYQAEPELPIFRELVVPAESVVGVKLDTAISSETANVEDRVDARVARDIQVNDDTVVPAGSRLIGSVTVVERGGRFSERARLGIRFDTLVLPDHSELSITTETIYRYGEARGNKTAAKIGGGAVAGAILGAIIGGSKGAAVGASTGAGAGTAVVMAGDRSEASFASGAEVTARILAPITVTLEE